MHLLYCALHEIRLILGFFECFRFGVAVIRMMEMLNLACEQVPSGELTEWKQNRLA